MNDLLQVAVNAHGGLARWNQLKTVKASLSITGAIWQVKGKSDVAADWPNAAGASGEVEGADVKDSGPKVSLDLNEVSLVDVDIVRFLGICQTEGVELLHCSPYIRDWIARERQS